MQWATNNAASSGDVQSQISSSNTENSTLTLVMSLFTPEQIRQMMEFVNYKGDSDTKLNMAGMILCGFTRSSFALDWIVDNGAI